MAAVDPAYAAWLKGDALFRGWANSLLPGALAPMAVDSEVVSPFAASAAVDTEIVRQGGFLGSALALDTASIRGKRADLVGKCVTLLGDQLSYVAVSEKVTNGDFSGGTTGWTATGGATLSIVSGQLKVLATTSVGTGAGQVISGLTIGQRYRVSVGAMNDPSGNYSRVTLFNAAAGVYSSLWEESVVGAAGFVADFIAPNPTLTLALEVATSGAWGPISQFALFDNISLKEYPDPVVLVIGAQEQDDGTTQLTVLRKL